MAIWTQFLTILQLEQFLIKHKDASNTKDYADVLEEIRNRKLKQLL